jgi:hypothetical protein
MDQITTEAEWLACTDPLPMVNAAADKTSDRKLRLLVVACCRRIWPLLQDDELREGAEMAERYADRMCTDDERAAATRSAGEAVKAIRHSGATSFLALAGRAVLVACSQDGYLGSRIHSFVGRYSRWSYAVMRGIDAAAEAALSQAAAPEREGRCNLLRCIFGNPFCTQPAIDSAWLSWNGSIVKRLAEEAMRNG